jgi:hypothetical protein
MFLAFPSVRGNSGEILSGRTGVGALNQGGHIGLPPQKILPVGAQIGIRAQGCLSDCLAQSGPPFTPFRKGGVILYRFKFI